MKTKNTKGFLLCLALLVMGVSSIPTISLAQTFKQAGPTNVGGRVRALLWDKSDLTYKTVYAGGVAGGLYISVNEGKSWVPVKHGTAKGDSAIANAAISCITQDAAGNIYVGTGEGFLNTTNSNSVLNTTIKGKLGCGIFVKRVGTNEFVQLKNTVPEEYTPEDKWSYINELECTPSGTLYAATNKGVMYSSNATDVNGTWAESSITTLVQDIKVQGNTVYFSCYYNAANGIVVRKATNQDLSGSTIIFSKTTTAPNVVSTTQLGRIEIAITPLDENFIYISVPDVLGTFIGVFVSENQGNTWRKITPTSSSLILDGNYSNTLVVDSKDKEVVYCGGYMLGKGTDFNQESYYYWDNLSFPTFYTVAPNQSDEDYYYFSHYLHTNIHAIVFNPNPNFDKSKDTVQYLIASDGGITYFGKRQDGAEGYQVSNGGLNITQLYSVAAANDGSVMAGAQGNGSVYIASPFYADETLTDLERITLLNSSKADVVAFSTNTMSEGQLSLNTGGYTNASMFQQNEPKVKRNFFLTQPESRTAELGTNNFARAYGDYYNYAGSQAWNYGAAFIGADEDGVVLSPSSEEVTVSALWETTEGTAIYDSINCKLRTGMHVYKPYSPEDDNDIATGKAFTTYISEIEKYTVYTLGKQNSDTTINVIKNGYKVFVRSTPHFDYPFLHTFTSNYSFDTIAVKEDTISFSVSNPLQNRYFVADNNGVIVVMSPTDFTQSPGTWYRILSFVQSGGRFIEKAQSIVVSNDGDDVFIVANSKEDATSKIYRVSKLLNFTGEINDLEKTEIKSFSRPITSLSLDPQDNNKMLITFGNITAITANIMYADNALTAGDQALNCVSKLGTGLDGQKVPVYAALIEMNNSNTVFIGTDKGIYVTTNLNSAQPVWVKDNTVMSPVSMIVQQTNNIAPVKTSYPTEGPYQPYSWVAASNYGAIYVATYGKGIYYSTDYLQAPKDSLIGIKQTKLPKNLSTNTLKIYPNPAKDNANIEFSLSKPSNVSVKIYSISGTLVYSQNLGVKTKGIQPIMCNKLSKGIFVVQLVTETNVMTSKIIIN